MMTFFKYFFLDKYTVDHLLSDRISVHRTVGEHRHPVCIHLHKTGYNYQKLSNYKTSIIITFFNEG